MAEVPVKSLASLQRSRQRRQRHSKIQVFDPLAFQSASTPFGWQPTSGSERFNLARRSSSGFGLSS